MKEIIFLNWFSFQNYQIRDFNLIWSFAMHLVWSVFIKYIHQIIEDLNALNNICRFMMCYIDWIFHYVMGYKNNEIQYMGMHNSIRVYCFIYDDIQYYQIKTYSFEVRCNSMKCCSYNFQISNYLNKYRIAFLQNLYHRDIWNNW